MEEVSTECLKWSSFPDYLTKAFQSTNESDSFTDVTFIVENRKISAHKIILSASSHFLENVLSNVPNEVHPIITLDEVEFEDLEAVISFIYHGEVNIDSGRFDGVLEAAKCLQIKGLMEVNAVGNNACEAMPEVEASAVESIEQETIEENCLGEEMLNLLAYNDECNNQNYVTEQQLTFEFLDDNPDVIKPSNDINQTFDESNNKINKGFKKVRKKCAMSSRICKSPNSVYTDLNLEAALEDLKNGMKLSAAASVHNIPKSTLYLHAKAKGALLSVARTEHSEQDVQNAIKAVMEGSSLKQAGDQFQIPKTVLWRRLRKKLDGTGSDILSQRRRLHDPALKEKASQALQKGQSISFIAKKYNIPIATVFRQKKYLVEQGRLDPCSIRKPRRNIIKNAVKAVLSGESLNQAAAMYNVSKTTVWRHLREVEKQQMEAEERPCYIIIGDEDSMLHSNLQVL